MVVLQLQGRLVDVSSLSPLLFSCVGGAASVASGVAMGVMPPAASLPPMPVISSGSISAPVLGSQLQAQQMAMSSLGIPLIPATVMTPGISSSATSGQSVMLPGGMYLGDGVMPLPQRLVKKILELQFVEMFELQPEAWLMESLEEDCTAKCCSASTRRRRAR